ncbi:MAG: penicillin-binding protein 2 [Actinomycetota bacterium]
MRIAKRAGLKLRPAETTYSRPDSSEENLRRRVAILGIIIITAFVVLFARLWFMQIVSGNDYRKRAEGNSIREISLEAPRGRILDRNGQVIVKNRNAPTISVVPAEMGDERKAVVSRLSRLLGMGVDEINEKIDKSQSPNQRAVLIRNDVGEDTITYVSEHRQEFPGVIAGTRPVRDYPYASLAAHVIGYLGEIGPEALEEKKSKGYQAGDEIGLSGIENTYDEELRGRVGSLRLEVDAQGNSIREISRREPAAGVSVRTTIDKNVQELVEASLDMGVQMARARQDAESPEPYKATGASAVVMDPKTGEVIAMASYPSYDLNSFVGGISEKLWKELIAPANLYPLNNRAIMSEIPPGSTFKVVPALAALTEGTFDIHSPFDCNHVFTTGEFKDFPKTCWSTHHHLDLFNGIIQSCDVVFYNIGYNFYNRQKDNQGRPLWDYARDFQLGKATGIDLTSEMNGRIPSPEWKKEFNKKNPDFQMWYPGDTVNMAIGQGDILTTPLQMAYLYSGIANGGKFVRPHVMKSLEDVDGEVVKKAEPESAAELDMSPENLALVNQALTGVVQGKGTAAATFEGFPVNQVPVAGKTGTSEILGKQPTAWFCCFAPANDPKYVIAVAIEQGGHGGESAAPVARRILEGLFDLPAQGEIRPSTGD